jgi:multidrug resistance protein MdtO
LLPVSVPSRAGSRPEANGSVSHAGPQIAFAFFYSVIQGYAPNTDLDNVRNGVVGILLALLVTAFVFNYIWPERSKPR